MILRNCCPAWSMPAAVQRLRIWSSCQRLTLRCVERTISIIEAHGFVEESVCESCPSIPSRIASGCRPSPRVARRRRRAGAVGR
jgi:hypothetical protein